MKYFYEINSDEPDSRKGDFQVDTKDLRSDSKASRQPGQLQLLIPLVDYIRTMSS